MSSPSRVHRASAAVRPCSSVSAIPPDQGKRFAVVRSHSSGLLAKVRVAGSNPVVRSRKVAHWISAGCAVRDSWHSNPKSPESATPSPAIWAG